MANRSSKEELYQFVNDLRQQLGIQLPFSYPLSTIKLCNTRMNVTVDLYPFTSKGMCGVAMLGEKSDTIILNSNRNPSELNFDCGHELIHLTHHRNIGEDCFKCFAEPRPEQDTFLEWQANEGSAEMLVPYGLLLPKIKDAYDDIRSWVDLKRLTFVLATDFDVPMAVITYRLESLKCEIFQYNAGVPLRHLVFLSDAELKRRNLYIPSLNDQFPSHSLSPNNGTAFVPISKTLSEMGFC